jgi:hypothetical protein
MALNAEQQKIVDAVIERAEQACRYVLKHNETAWSGDGEPSDDYKSGFEVASKVCEGAIRDAVMRHIEADLAQQSTT